MIQDSPSTQGRSLCTRLAHVPRLSISHLLQWTAFTALVLFVEAGVDGVLINPPWRYVAAFVARNVLFGCVVFAAVLIVSHKSRGTLWTLEPGEWLVLGAASVWLAWSAEKAAYWFGGGLTERLANPFITVIGPPEIWWTKLVRVASTAVMVILYLTAAIALRKRPWWCGLCWAVVVFLVVPLYSYLDWREPDVWAWLFSGDTILAFVILILALLCASVLSDRGQPRHWLHWCGVAATVLLIGAAIILLQG